MNTLNGYSKSTLTDSYVLTASGGHRAIGNSDGNIPLNNGTVNTNLRSEYAQFLLGVTIDIEVAGDKETYYPVSIKFCGRKELPNIITIWKNLGSKTAVYTGNHSKGTSSMLYRYECRNAGWDGNQTYFKTLVASYTYAPLVAHTEISSKDRGLLIIWLRGGGTTYKISADSPLTYNATDHTKSDIRICYETTNIGSSGAPVNVSPKTEIDNAGIYSNGYFGYGNFYGNATTATTATNAKYLLTLQKDNTNFYSDTYEAYLKWESSDTAAFKFNDGTYKFRADLATVANGAYYVYDYNATTTPIYIGYASTALTSATASHLAAYGTTSSGARCIKDITGAEVKKFIGLGNVANYDQSKAIKSITRSGTTFTYTCLDGTTGTFTQQDNNSTYNVYGKTINGNFSTQYRTQTKGNTTNGWYLSAIRNDTASVANSPQYGTGVAFGMGDTHGYLYMNYNSAAVYVGAGNVDKLNWVGLLAFKTDIPTKTSQLTNDSGFVTGGPYATTAELNKWAPKIAYNLNTGYLVKTKIPTASNTMVTFKIVGNNYNAESGVVSQSILTTGLFYNYKDSNSILAASVKHHGYNFGNVTAFCYNDFVYIWFKQGANYQSFMVTVYDGNVSTTAGNMVDTITNAAIPTSGVTRKVEITPVVDSVSGGGSAGGSSITVNIGGVSKTLTIPTTLPTTVSTGSTNAYRAIVVHSGNSLYSAGTGTGKPRYNYSTGDVKAYSFTTDGGSFISSLTTGTHLKGNLGTAIINSTAAAGYNMLARMKSTNGVFTTGAYNGDYMLYYTDDATISAGTNGTTKSVVLLNESGDSLFSRRVQSSYFKSTVATGTQPYACSSTTCNTNLNADLLDGTHKSGLLTSVTSSATTNLSVVVGGTTKSVTDLYARKLVHSTNTITSTAQDTTANWSALNNTVHYYNSLLLTDQPSQYGMLLNFNNGSSDVHQIWMTLASGFLYHRGGNAAGWSGSWRRIIDSSDASAVKIWTASIKGQTWSRLCKVAYASSVVGASYIINIKGTRDSVVYNNTYMVTTHHSGKGHIVAIGSSNYSEVTVRVCVDSTGNSYFELKDSAKSIATSTSQSVYCTLVPMGCGSVTLYTAFTSGATLDSGYTASTELITRTIDSCIHAANFSASGITRSAEFALQKNTSTLSYTHQYIGTVGTTSTGGVAYFNLGNSTATGTADNAKGILRIYGSSTGSTQILCGTNNTTAYTLYLPGASGLFVYHTNDTAIGSGTKPVYIAATGQATASASTVGSLTRSVYLNAGTITQTAHSNGYYSYSAYIGTVVLYIEFRKYTISDFSIVQMRLQLTRATGVFKTASNGSTNYLIPASYRPLNTFETCLFSQANNNDKYNRAVNVKVGSSGIIEMLSSGTPDWVTAEFDGLQEMTTIYIAANNTAGS